MLSYRQQILLGYLGVFLIFMILLFPLSSQFATRLTVRAMASRADGLISKLSLAQDQSTLVRRLRDQRPLLFFRASLIDSQLLTLYDTHTVRTKRAAGPLRPVEHPEVLQALREGVGEAVGFSDMLGQEFLYLAKRFDLKGDTYVLRMAVPYTYVAALTRDVEFSFLVAGSLFLLIFTTLSWFIVSWLSQPVQQIIDDIRPYQEGLQSDLPVIELKAVRAHDDFFRLATTLNQLAERSRQHIATLQAERNDKEALLESLVEGVLSIDPQLVVRDCNEAALEMLGKSRSEVLAHPLKDLGLPKIVPLVLDCLDSGELQTCTLEFVSAEISHLDVVAAPSATLQGAVIVLVDTSIQHNILEMRKEFIANASHELKTPITIITGFAETMRDNPELPREMCVDITDKIIRNCNRMNRLVKDLLALADIERLPESSVQDVDLFDLCEMCERQLKTAYPDAQLTLKHHGRDFQLEGDPSLLEMAVGNLLSNAAKYSEPPAQILVDLRDEGDELILSVADKGYGIPKEDQPRIWERFYTVDKARSRKMGGTGLGLSIVKTIIEKHYGSIHLESEPGVGTTFTVRLPKERNHA